ncbi:hypothetical protein WG66_007371 [Moniliophthora roreri]|nr:hypothetical protein WG66_007371 [Moniliophthora roreri]
MLSVIPAQHSTPFHLGVHVDTKNKSKCSEGTTLTPIANCPPTNIEMSSAYEETLAPYLTLQNVLVKPAAKFIVSFFLYGLYTPIFGMCLHILLQRHNRPNRHLYLGGTISLFFLITSLNIIDTYGNFRQAAIYFEAATTKEHDPALAYLRGNKFKTIWKALTQVFGIMTSIISNSMLMHRCYVIWGCRRRFAVPMIIVLITVSLIGILQGIMITIGISNTEDPTKQALFQAGPKLNLVFRIANTLFNLSLTCLTAGRIWYIARQLENQKKYCPIIAIIYIISPARYGGMPFDFFEVVYHACGIAPTLITVRTAAGRSVENVPGPIFSTIRFTSHTVTDMDEVRVDLRGSDENEK